MHDVTGETGITFVHTDGSSGRRYMFEPMSAGLALFDYNGDGLLDIYFLNGAPLRGTPAPATPPRNALYRNDGGFRFTDVTDAAGVGDTGYGLGVAVGDYNNDGRPDIYINNYGPNVLYRNNGDGTFTDVARAAGVADGDQVGAGTCFLDIDGDGDLDLFVAHYVGFTYERHQIIYFGGHPAYAGPRSLPPTRNALYRNNGDGTFADVSDESGIAAREGTGMGIVCADYDGDGDTDIVVGNDSGPNFVFENDGTGRFKEVGLEAGLAYDGQGLVQGTMGVECADYDNDGLLDFHATSYRFELATLYRNLGSGWFDDVTRETGAGNGTYPTLTWGSGLVDFDNDGDRDLFVACGHLQDNVELYDQTATYAVRNLLLMNTGDGRFVNVSDRAGDGMQVRRSSRGAVFGDLDNDGDVDAVIQNSRQGPTVLRNDTAPGHHWIQIVLRGTRTNRDGVGAHVTVVAGDLRQLDEVHSGRGYQGHFGSRLHFGLGKRDRIDRIEVRWIGGGVDVVKNVAVDRIITITEGSAAADGPSAPAPAAAGR
ncbi:MAG: CRTAC1 family protein [Acidobacteria bacterium]|nr:CRTAC1 family protein [Acidobacteriota bacterium]